MGIYKGNTITLDSRPRIGMNLEDSAYYGTELPFNNLAMNVSAWVSSSGGGYANGLPIPANASGFPSGTFPPGHYATFIIQMGSGHYPGFYNVSWTPTNATVTVSPSFANAYTYLKPTGLTTFLILAYSGLTSLAVHRSGESTSYESVFREPYIRRLRNYDTLRFMDWQRTNYTRGPDVTWENRVPPGYYSHSLSTGSGVAFEHIIDLCNETDCNPWLCIHHQATNDYIIHVAELVKQRLKPGLRLYLEHSNEVWNGIFPQRQFCIDNGPTGVVDATVRGLVYHQKRSAEIGQVFKSSGIPTTVVLNWQTAGGASYFDFASSNGFSYSGAPLIDAVAIAPYFGGININTNSGNASGILTYGIPWIVGECWKDMRVQRDFIRQWVSGTRKRGWDLVGYEGGQHLSTLASPYHQDPVMIQLFTDVNRSQEMYELYRAYLQMWHEETNNGLMCLFSSSSSFSQFGHWGLTEYEGQKDSPKYRAVMDHIAQLRLDERGRY